MTITLATFTEAFLSLFVAMNVLGVLPLFIGLTEGMKTGERRRLVVRATTTAFVIALVILLTGRFIFETLGITLNDLRIGGGIILLVLSITDLLFSNLTRQPSSNAVPEADLAAVPLGTPLIVGPAAITAILVLQQSVGYGPTLAALLVNLLITLTVFIFGPTLIGYLGASASKAFAKVASLFLAAISVALIRTGITDTIMSLPG
ncbi:MarC family protein [Salisaeta longa]|uniref:MarC family protein n=1 Tax=Salisaeta longa TaxID=503170 RepID=UPI0003B5E158|nr:MarC family protein [Salisaeta longa]